MGLRKILFRPYYSAGQHVIYPGHPHLMTDKELANQALPLFDLILSIESNKQNISFYKLYEVLEELYRLALEAMDAVTEM